jgi:hypothetical protein
MARRSVGNNLFCKPYQTDGINAAVTPKNFCFVFSEDMFYSRGLAPCRGTYARRHERRVRDAVGVSGCSVVHATPTNNLMRTVKSCGPDVPELASNSRRR